MLSQSSVSVERKYPRWLAAAVGLLTCAVLVWNLGQSLAAEPAAKDKKAQADRKVEPKKAEPRNEDVDNPADLIRKALPGLPNGAVPDDLEQLMHLRQQYIQMLQQLQHLPGRVPGGGFPGIIPGGGFPGIIPGGGFPGIDPIQFEDAQRRGIDQQPAAVPRGRYNEGRLGIGGSAPSPVLAEQFDLPKGTGFVVEQVQPNSAADKAGLKVNDILLEVNGKPVASELRDLSKMLEDVKANTPVDAIVLRKSKKEIIQGISLPEQKERPQARPQPQLGVINIFPNRAHGLNRAPAAPAVPGAKGVVTTFLMTDNRFETRHQDGKLSIALKGSITDGKAKLEEIVVQDGNETNRYEDLEKVHDQYRDKIKHLLDMNEKNHLKIEVKAQ